VKVTSDVKLWLSHSSVQSYFQIFDKYTEESIVQYSCQLLNNLDKTTNLLKPEILGPFQDCLSAKNQKRGVSALVIEPKGLNIAYYCFKNGDDKYFLLDKNGTGFQDSCLYQDFYKTLPDLQQVRPIYKFIAKKKSVWIFPRAQYGHYIYDEVLPSLVGYFLAANEPPESVHMIISRPWQYQVVSSLLELLFGKVISIVLHKAPSLTSLLQITGGYIMIPSYWRLHMRAKEMIHSNIMVNQAESRGSKIFLTRHGFDNVKQNRILNYGEISNTLTSNNFQTVAPHKYTLKALSHILSNAKLIVSESGTIPLLAYITSSISCEIIPMFSFRCISDCDDKYIYSGWRYHIPWLSSIQKVAWGIPNEFNTNPFSDKCWYNKSYFQDL